MKITVIMEDTCGHPQCIYQHGLSIYIETDKHRLLLDTGASDAILDNAKVLGIDLTLVDSVFLSHGHYDHSGGVMGFSSINPHARIYMQRTAAYDYYHGEKYIGIDKRITDLPQVCMADGDMEIDEELSLFTHITGRRLWPRDNTTLTRRTGEIALQDAFDHEQCLVITQGGKKVLLSGCAHNGILNILDRFREKYGCFPEMVISGFHMTQKEGYTQDDIRSIRETAEELAGMDTLFYTGHCTGQTAFDIMKPVMGDKLRQLHSGMELE